MARALACPGTFHSPKSYANTYAAPVADEFERVNQLIIEQLHSDVPMVENVGHYIVDAGGKRLRPLLALLCASALGQCDEQHIRFCRDH